jgi:hypothetical protein
MMDQTMDRLAKIIEYSMMYCESIFFVFEMI